MTTTADAAAGRWPEILGHFGFTSADLDRRNKPCPVTGEGTDRFRFCNKKGDGRYFCHCWDGTGSGIDLVACKLRTDFKTAAAEVDQYLGRKHDKPQRKQKEVNYSEVLMAKTVVSATSAYLAGRGLEVAPGLRFIRPITYKDQGEPDVTGLSGMVAPITKDGKLCMAHVTYLQNGKKADVRAPRKLMPGDDWQGGACELYPLEGPILGIAEGVETAIAAKMLNLHPVWSVLNTSGMKNWIPPQGIEEIIIYADNDAHYAGHAAAYSLAHKLSGGQHGKFKVTVVVPPTVGDDWNDVLLKIKGSEK